MSKEEISIRPKDVIDDNYHLLAVMGVFGAMTALFVRLELGEFPALISFLLYLLTGSEVFLSFIDNLTRIAREKGWETTCKVHVSLFVFIFLLAMLMGSVVSFLVIFYGGILFFVSVSIGIVLIVIFRSSERRKRTKET